MLGSRVQPDGDADFASDTSSSFPGLTSVGSVRRLNDNPSLFGRNACDKMEDLGNIFCEWNTFGSGIQLIYGPEIEPRMSGMSAGQETSKMHKNNRTSSSRIRADETSTDLRGGSETVDEPARKKSKRRHRCRRPPMWLRKPKVHDMDRVHSANEDSAVPQQTNSESGQVNVRGKRKRVRRRRPGRTRKRPLPPEDEPLSTAITATTLSGDSIGTLATQVHPSRNKRSKTYKRLERLRRYQEQFSSAIHPESRLLQHFGLDVFLHSDTTL
ncbi:hypothetical protein BV898_16647 [Hypsibius exemplaris]|uniref:Uncharacterized protein n=1 Tax=Hypsibius exemplaris TaxID=2072580 RepID=A0A9X6RLB7_HYPEX|nr:hypothetical protein BV898_16647 [Hypsibius exemplaris]